MTFVILVMILAGYIFIDSAINNTTLKQEITKWVT